jgi:tripartite motif-containing protein 71
MTRAIGRFIAVSALCLTVVGTTGLPAGVATEAFRGSFDAAGGTVPPTYVDTIGGGSRGHAEMYPSGLDTDRFGNVFVADTGNDRIRRYSSTGRLVWRRGTRGTKAPGRFENPRDVAVHARKVYVADTGYNRVQVLNANDGSVHSVWGTRFGTIMGISAGVDGNGNPIILVSESSANAIRIYSPAGSLIRSVGSGPGQLDGVRDAATDRAGNIFAADFANSRVVKFGPLGVVLDSWGVNGTRRGQLKRPYGIEVDRSGNVYVADSNNYVHKFTSGGTFLTAYGAPGRGRGRFQMLRRVALGPGDPPAVYGADLWTYKIEMFGQGGRHIRTLGGDRPDKGFFNEPYGLAVSRRHVFVADMVNQRIQRFSSKRPFGFHLSWGARGWGEGTPGFNWARDATIGSFGGSKTVWVADTKNDRFTEFWLDGTPTGRRFGRTGSGIGALNWPHAVDAAGSALIVADTRNDRVQRWDPAAASVAWSVGWAADQALSAPKDVAVSSGEVFVADTQNRRIVVLSADTGRFIRQFGSTVLRRPEGVAVEPNGDVWVADTDQDRLVEFSNGGVVLQTFGSSGRTNVKFNKPAHLEVLVRRTGLFLFVTDSWNDRVQIYDIG